MQAGKLPGKRFLQGIFEEQSEIRVVRDGYDIDAGFGGFADRGYDRLAFFGARRISRRVVREVQHDDRFSFIFLRQQRFAQSLRIEAAVRIIERIVHKLGAAADAEGQLVVFPVLIRNDDGVAGTGEQVGDDAESVRKRIGDDRIAESFALQGRILLDHLCAPGGTQLRLPGRRAYS